MSDGLLRARGQIAFLVGLVLASALVFWLDQQQVVPVSDLKPAVQAIRPSPEKAKSAWRYFEQNTNRQTGLVSSMNRGTSTTAADIGHELQAALAAHRLGLISGRDLYHRLALALDALTRLDVARAGTNAYDARSLKTIAEPGGDPQVLLGALELIVWSYPANSDAALRALQHWRGAERSAHPVRTTPSDAARYATTLVNAAMQHRGDK